jgi:hypothetical protein
MGRNGATDGRFLTPYLPDLPFPPYLPLCCQSRCSAP